MEKTKKRRNIIIFAIITIVITLAILSFAWYQIHEFKKAKLQLQNIEDNLNVVQENLENAQNKAMEGFDFTENLIEQNTQELESAKAKLLDVKKFLSELENCEKSEMRIIYEAAKDKMQEASQLLLKVNVASILLAREQAISNVSDTCDREEEKLTIVQEMLDDWNYDKLDIGDTYNRYNEMCELIASIRESTQKTAVDMQSKINNVYPQKVLRQIEEYESRLCEFQDIIEEYERTEKAKQTLLEKINSLVISQNIDMSKPIGFTEEELRYLLERIGLVQQRNPEIIDVLPRVMVEAIKDYPVNELFSIAVMSLETGYFRSDLAVKNFNYGGMMGTHGKALTFDNMEEGLIAAIRCLYRNLKGSNTIFEVNQSYCSPTDLNGDGKIEGNAERYQWSYQVMSIMTRYKNAVLKGLS